METDATTPRAAISRYCCPFPGCNRSFRDFWRLKVHYRAQPGARGSGVERGHGQELPHCPLCLAKLDDVKYHKCSAGPAAQAATGTNKKGAGAQAQQNGGTVSNGAVSALRPTVTWPQHLSVSTTGPAPLQTSFGHGGTLVGHHSLVTTVAQGQLQHQHSIQHHRHPQQQQQVVVVQNAMQPEQPHMQQQHHHLQPPGKQLWVQTRAAPGPSSSAGTTISAHVTASFQPQSSHQQQYPQQQAWQGQQVSAPVAAVGPYNQAHQQQQQQVWQDQYQQQAHHNQQVQVQVSAGISAQPYTTVSAAAGIMLQQQQLEVAAQLLGLGQQHQHPQQLDARQLSPVITLPSNHPSNTNNAGGGVSGLYRPSPRLSADGCLNSFLLPRLSAHGGGFGGLGSSQWGLAAAAGASATAGFAPAAVSAFRQPATVSLQQQQQQPHQVQQQQGFWPPQQQQQEVQQAAPQQLPPQQLHPGAVPCQQGMPGKVSNNSGSSISGEWAPAPAAAAAAPQSGALTGLIQGFAAEMQVRAYLQHGGATQQQQQQQQVSVQQQAGSWASNSSGVQGYQGFTPAAVPLAQGWLQQPAAAADAHLQGAGAAPLPGSSTLLGLTTPTAAAAAAGGGLDGQAILVLPEFALRIAEEFKAALGVLRGSMARHNGHGTQAQGPEGAEGDQQQRALCRHASSSGSNSPVNSSHGKAPLPGSCESMMALSEQQQQQARQQQQSREQPQEQEPPAAVHVGEAACPPDSSPDAGSRSADSKRLAEESSAAAAAAGPPVDAAGGQQPAAKKVKLSWTGSAQLPPLGNGAALRSSAGSPSKPAGSGATGTPPRPPLPAAAGNPFAAAAGVGLPPQEGSAGGVSRPASALGLTRSCSVWSDTPPPPEAPAALLELAAQMQQDAGALQIPETADAAAAPGQAPPGAAPWQQQQGMHHPVSSAAVLAAAAQELLALPASQVDDDEQCGSQRHRALVASLMRKATDDARACGLADPSPLVTQLMAILDEHVAALSQLGSPGTELGVASAGGVTVELPNAPSVGGSPEHAAAVDQCANSAAADDLAATGAALQG